MLKEYRLELKEKHPLMVEEATFRLDEEDHMLDSSKKVVDLCNRTFRLWRRAEEHLLLLCLDQRNAPLGLFEVSHGSSSRSLAGAREIYIRALLCGATAIILLHNHPSGNTEPSEDDDYVCERLAEAGEMIGIELLDFIIVGEGYYSYREEERVLG